MTKWQRMGAKLLAALSPIIILVFVGTGLLYGWKFMSEALVLMFCEISIITCVAWLFCGFFVWSDE